MEGRDTEISCSINTQCLPAPCGWALLMPADVETMDRLQTNHWHCTHLFLVIHGDGNLHPPSPSESHQMVHLLLAQVRRSARAREALSAFLADDPLALEGTA